MNLFPDHQRIIEIIKVGPDHYTEISNLLSNDRKSKQRWEDVAKRLQLAQDDIEAINIASSDNTQLQMENTFKKICERKNLTFDQLGTALGLEGCHEAVGEFYYIEAASNKVNKQFLH